MNPVSSKVLTLAVGVCLTSAVSMGCGGRSGGGISGGGTTDVGSSSSSDPSSVASEVNTGNTSQGAETAPQSDASGSAADAGGSSTGDPSTDDEQGSTSPIDWLHPPGGVPFDLPQEYGTARWVDVRARLESATYDDTQCSTFYDDQAGAFGRVECQSGFEGWQCQCYDAPNSFEFIGVPAYFVDTARDPSEACRLGAAICLTELPAVDGQCYVLENEGGLSPHGCSVRERCVYDYATPHGDLTKTTLMPLVACGEHSAYPYPDVTQYLCTEEGSDWRIVGTLDAQPGRRLNETCGVGVQVFREGWDPGSDGAITCRPQAPTVSVINGVERSCEATFQCARSVTVSGEPVEVEYSPRVVGCVATGDEWNCRCEDDPLTRTQVGDGAQACTNATNDCIARVSL